MLGVDHFRKSHSYPIGGIEDFDNRMGFIGRITYGDNPQPQEQSGAKSGYVNEAAKQAAYAILMRE